jgi:hypothetical protein
MRRYFTFTVGVLVGSFGLTNSANAYIDPGTGSLLLQGLIASVAAGVTAVGLYWHRLIGFFRAPSKGDRGNQAPDGEDPEGS